MCDVIISVLIVAVFICLFVFREEKFYFKDYSQCFKAKLSDYKETCICLR